MNLYITYCYFVSLTHKHSSCCIGNINEITEVSATPSPQDNTRTDDYKIKKHIIDILKGRDGRDGRDGLPGTKEKKETKEKLDPLGHKE